MLITLGIIGIIVGTGLLILSGRFQKRNATLEIWCGGLFLSGIVLLAMAFPRI